MRKIQILAGSRISGAIGEAIEAAKDGGPVEFDFNGVTVHVAGDSDPQLIYRDWNRSMMRTGGFIVGPYPSAELSAEDLAEDAKLEEARRVREAARQAEYERRQKAAEERLAAALAEAPAMAFNEGGAALWQSWVEANVDGYGAAVVRFAETWGRLMQAQIEQGAPLAEIADDRCSLADGPEGITGFMYGAAVAMLAQAWKYGEELRRWHNLKTQLGDEGERANESGGTLNPALLITGSA